jgi:predicted nuclease with TOPRIM domain
MTFICRDNLLISESKCEDSRKDVHTLQESLNKIQEENATLLTKHNDITTEFEKFTSESTSLKEENCRLAEEAEMLRNRVKLLEETTISQDMFAEVEAKVNVYLGNYRIYI